MTNDAPLFDLDRLRSAAPVGRIEFHRELPSTSDLALQWAQAEQLETPLLVLAELQTAGRGRGANRWWAAPGALTFSLLIQSPLTELPVGRWPLVSLTAGLAVCEALAELLPGSDLGLKWPNDIHLNGRKVCGILVEVPPRRTGRLVLGIGLNVNNSFHSAPDQLQATATSLRDTTGYPFHLTEVLLAVLRHLDDELPRMGAQDHKLQQRWQTLSVLEGRTVHLQVGTRQVVGVCQGIDDQGALLLQTETGPQRCAAGIVTRYE